MNKKLEKYLNDRPGIGGGKFKLILKETFDPKEEIIEQPKIQMMGNRFNEILEKIKEQEKI